jgi:hypothetical protein
MKHAHIRKLLAVYRDLNDADRLTVDEHIQGCPACSELQTSYRATDRDLAALADPRPDERLRREFYVNTGIRRQPGDAPAKSSHWLTRLPVLTGQILELAMLVLLIAVLSFLLGNWFQSTVIPSVSISSTSGLPTSLSVIETDLSADPVLVTTPTGGQATKTDAINSQRASDELNPDRMSEAKSPVAPTTLTLSAAPSTQETFALVTARAEGGEEEGRIYIVQKDDSLWKLAEKYLGDGRRFGEILEATQAKRTEDPSFALIEDPSRILPGSKLWIPTAVMPPTQAEASGVPTPISAPVKEPSPAQVGPGGHIAFSFWNDHPDRCTYEINIIDVAACLSSPQSCQATRRIFSLNNVSEPAMAPAGDRLAFRGWGKPPTEDSPYLDCAPPLEARYLANTTLDGTELRGTGGFWEDSHPDWSPDGQRLLFDSQRHEDRISRIFLISADGSNERDLRITGQHPSWAGDNERFVFRGCDLTGNRCGLWLAYATPAMPWEPGANLIQPIVQDEQAAHPDWSPVSDQVVYQSPLSGSWNLYVVSAEALEQNGNSPLQLTDDPGTEGLPTWSPDGNWIAYLSDVGGNWGIWIIRANGSERHLLFNFDGGNFTPQPVEPYGQRDWVDEQISWAR